MLPPVEITVEDLHWDAFNQEHITQHGVTPDEVEEICQGTVLALRSYSNRYVITRPTGAGRLITVILGQTPQNDIFYPISARPASVRERRWYRQQQGSSG